MKHYPKEYENISQKPSETVIAHIGSSTGSTDDLAIRFKNFYKSAHPVLFDFVVKEVWLEQQFLYNGSRRASRSGNGFTPDRAFGYFIKSIVGISQKPLTTGVTFVAVPTYFKDFFPNFTDHDPFTEPEYFAYPYKHVTLDHLSFVYQCHNRLEMLDEAEKRSMNIQEFEDWATNAALCYNDEIGKEQYSVVRHSFIPYLKRND